MLEILRKYRPVNVLEVGCAHDSIFNYYKDYDRAVIVEPSKQYYDKAKMEFSCDEKIFLYRDFFEDIAPTFEKQFDFVIVSSLLHEVDGPETLLSSVKEVCLQSTIVHINVPNSKSFHLLLGYFSGFMEKLGTLTDTARSLQQNTVFDIDALIACVESVGFEILEKGSYFLKPFNHKKMQQCLENGIIDKKILDGLYKMVEYMPDLGSEIFVNCKVK